MNILFLSYFIIKKPSADSAYKLFWFEYGLNTFTLLQTKQWSQGGHFLFEKSLNLLHGILPETSHVLHVGGLALFASQEPSCLSPTGIWGQKGQKASFFFFGCTVQHVELPRPGVEPVTPALAGGFLTTPPPGKPQKSVF